MGVQPRYVPMADEHEFTFSVCSLVRDRKRYEEMVRSAEKHGFTSKNSEFIAADNRDRNEFDGYNWQKRLYRECRGRYIVYCHEDIEFIDGGFDELVRLLEQLDEVDETWLVTGVAGSGWRTDNGEHRRQVTRISDKNGSRRVGVFPGRVESLDECFIVTRRDKPIFGSYDLSGFHFYGADLCVAAELMGGSAYSIDFHLYHHGQGQRGPSYRQAKRAFAEKYTDIFPGRKLYCTTGAVQL